MTATIAILALTLPVCPPLFAAGPGAFSPTVPLEAKAEDSARSAITVFADSTWKPPRAAVDPKKAMLHSLAFPGWGQWDNGSKKKAALFFVAEAVCVGGYIYMNHQVRHGDYEDWERENMRTDRNSFLIYFLAAKVLGMVDAYVDAHLTGFDVSDITPPELEKPEIAPGNE